VQKLSHIFQHLADKVEKFRAYRFNKNLVVLEQIYDRMRRSAKPGFADTIGAARRVIFAHIYSYELYIVVAGLGLLVISTGAFVQPGAEIGWLRPLFILLMALIAVAVLTLLAFVTLPLHFLYGVKLINLTMLQSILAANIVSLIGPAVSAMVLPVAPQGFYEFLIPNTIIFTLGLGFLTLRIRAIISFCAYQERHGTGGLDSILPLHLQGKLASVSARDHYVEIVTEKGVHLHRMAFGEAIDMLDEVKGMLVHRSHWVACNAMLSLDKSAGKFRLTLRDGGQLPVAKSKVEQVRCFLAARYK